MSSSRILLSLLSGLCLVVGCVGDSLELETVEQGLKSPGGGGDGCPVWGCGSNSPAIDALGFHELHEIDRYNLEGFRVVSFQKYWQSAWRSYRADVINGALVARNLATGAIVHSGSALVGARFEIYNRNNQHTYLLQVVGTGRVSMWARPNGLTRVTPTYRLQWTDPAMNPGGAILWTDLCGASNDPDGISNFYAVLFDDDRIDADSIRETGETADWFNIGCAGHTLAKQHLTGHTRAAAAILGVSTTLNQRTANLKMLSADYCGKGDPFTVPGQPLKWRDEYNWYNSIGGATTIEARWTENGAICLDKPRVDYHLIPLGQQTFPHGVEPLLAPAEGWCTSSNPRPPPCSGSPSSMQGAHLISVNY